MDIREFHIWLSGHQGVPERSNRDPRTVAQMRVSGPVEDGIVVHFTHDIDRILSSGFLHGTTDHTGLGITFNRRKAGPGFNFGYGLGWPEAKSMAEPPLWDNPEDHCHYGDSCLIFPASFVPVTHVGDGERQCVFVGADVDLDSALVARSLWLGDDRPHVWLLEGREMPWDDVAAAAEGRFQAASAMAF